MSDADSLKVPFSKPSISQEEEQCVLEVLRSGWLTTGKYALQFENDFSHFMNKDEGGKIRQNREKEGLSSAPVISLAVNSNTSVMILAMEACARHLGADVFFADIEKNSYSIDVLAVEALLKKDAASSKPRIKAIVPVHIAGNVCNMQKLCALAKQYNVKVIEDSAHAFPSKTQLGYAGTIGDIGVFSFYVTKTITTAEGGMVCTRDQELAKRMTVMRMHGMDRTTWDRYTSPRASWEYDIVAPGYKFNLPDVLAAIGCCQLKRAESFFEKRSKIVQKYNKAFSTLDFVQLPPDGEGNSWHLYLLRIVPEKLKIGRDDFAKALQKKGIGISVHFIPLFHFTYWKSLYPDFTALNFPNAESAWSRTVSIPLWPDMTDEMAEEVINAVIAIGKEYHA